MKKMSFFEQKFLITSAFNLSRVSMFSRRNICICYLYVATYRYDVQWHVAPLHIQKVILFLLQRGTKDFTISIGRLFVASLECFTTVRIYAVLYYDKDKVINILLKYRFFLSKLHITNKYYSW